MASATGNGDSVEHLEEVKAECAEEFFCGALFWLKASPCSVGLISFSEDAVDSFTGAQEFVYILGFSFVCKLELVLKINEAVVYRSCREHQDLGFDSRPDNTIHQLCVTVFLQVFVLVRSETTSVAEIVGFVNDYEVVVAPIDVLEIETV